MNLSLTQQSGSYTAEVALDHLDIALPHLEGTQGLIPAFASIPVAAKSLNEADKSHPSAAQTPWVVTVLVISLSVAFPAGGTAAVTFYLLSGIDYF